VSGFDIAQGRFNSDLFVWCKWLGKNEVPQIRFANGEIASQELVSEENDGEWHSVKWHIQGTFRGTFPLQTFPFDRQNLKIQIDLPEERGILVPDLAGSGMAKVFSITGWQYEPYFKAETETQSYFSDFGSLKNEGEPFKVSQVYFVLDMKRPLLPNLIKFFFPLIIVLLMSILAFFISPEEVEANLGISVTALLTCVALHFSLAESLPDVAYLVTVDKFFIVAYILIFFNVIETVLSFRIHQKKPELAIKIENYSWKGILLVMSVSFILILMIDLMPSAKRPAQTAALESRQSSSRDTLIISTPALVSLNSINIIPGLLTRGLYYEASDDKKVAHLAAGVPDLTNERVKFLDDGSVVVRWELKPGLKWGNGEPVTLDDMIWSLELVEDENRLKWVKTDKNTLDVHYHKRTSSVIRKFRLYPPAVFEKAFAEKAKENKDDQGNLIPLTLQQKNDIVDEIMKTSPPPLDGPYILKEYKKDEYADFTVNPFFAGRKPLIANIRIKVTKEKFPVTMKNKVADLGMNLSNESYEGVLPLDHLATRTDKNDSLYLLQPDTSAEPFNDLNFRKALIHAIDRKQAAILLAREGGKVAHSFRNDENSDYEPGVTRYEYSPSLAASYYRQSASRKPFKLICSKAVSGSPEFAAVQLILKNLQAAGMPVTLEITEGSVAKLYTAGDHGGLLYSNRSGTSNPLYFWTKPMITKKLNEQKASYQKTLFVERQTAIIKQLQLEWSQTLPLIPLVFSTYRSAFDKSLKNWNPVASSDNIFWNVEEWYFE
jgi:ABC-type transport system substrate-binding protein